MMEYEDIENEVGIICVLDCPDLVGGARAFLVLCDCGLDLTVAFEAVMLNVDDKKDVLETVSNASNC